MKQDVFADLLSKETGEEWTQQKVSLLEGKPDIDIMLLDQVSKVLKVSSDAIKNYDEEAAINIVSNSFHDQAVNMNYQCTINPIDALMEQVRKNEDLYKSLLAEKDQRIKLLEKLAGK